MCKFRRRLQLEPLEDRLALDAQLVAELNATTTASASPDFIANVTGQVVFTATSDGGEGVWVSDGTEAGTRALTSGDSSFFDLRDVFRTEPSRVGRSVAFFGESTTDNKSYVWATDGTPSGTSRLGEYSDSPVVADNLVYFWYQDRLDLQLWVSDGTPAGTRLFTTLNVNAITAATADGDRLYYADSENRLWVSDPNSGTMMISEIPGPSPSYSLIVLDETIYTRTGNGEYWLLKDDQWLQDSTIGSLTANLHANCPIWR